MGTYVCHGNYRLVEFIGRYYANTQIDLLQTPDGIDVTFYKTHPVHGKTFTGSLRLNGEGLEVANGEITAGTITTMQFYAWDFQFYAGELQDLEWDGSWFQSLLDGVTNSDFDPFYYALMTGFDVVRGDDSSGAFDYSKKYDATDIHLGGGDDRYSHRHRDDDLTLVIDGGEGHDFFSAFHIGQVTIDVANETFTDVYGRIHTIKNFEFFGGSRGNDTIIGAMDKENSLSGNQGSDLLYGGNLDDVFSPGSGSNTVWAYDGDDFIRAAGSSRDTVYGGDGTDTYAFQQYTTGTVYIDLENQEDNAFEAFGTVLIDVENLIGSDSYDTMLGDEENNVIETLGSSDLLNGRSGDDTLDGGEGNDTLIGGTGRNLLTGGTGADVFVFQEATARDTITDFETGIDTIDLSYLTSRSDRVTFQLDGLTSTRVSCFTENENEDLFFTFIETGNAVEIWLLPAEGRLASEATPLITLTGITLSELSYDDFIM